MNMDIVSSGVRLDERIVNYGEPSAQLIYRAIFGKGPDPNINLRGLKAVVEELDEEQWELLSLEYGEERKAASVWTCSSYIIETPLEKLHTDLKHVLRMLRQECIRLNITPAAWL